MKIIMYVWLGFFNNNVELKEEMGKSPHLTGIQPTYISRLF